MTTIDILVPMLGRPHAIDDLVECVMATYHHDYDYHLVFIASKSDHAVTEALEYSGEDYIVLPGEPRPGDFARKTNVGFKHTESEWVLLGASDIKLHEGWAKAAVEVGEEYNAGVVGTDDMGNPLVRRGKHSTHPLVRRSYIDQYGGGWDGPGVVYHEGYHHQYVDTELVTVAQARGMWVFAHGSKIEHLHPLWKKSAMDRTYERALSSGVQDARLFKQRSRLGARL